MTPSDRQHSPPKIRMIKILSALVIASFMLLPGVLVSVQAQNIPECNDCKEMRNIRNRICGTRAAQREYDRIASKLLAEEKTKGKPILLTSEIKDSIKACVLEVMTQAQDMDAQNAAGFTDSACRITVNRQWPNKPPSLCVEASVRRHEEHHRAECLEREKGKWQKVWNSDAPVKSALLDTKFAMSAIDYMAEESAAYAMEEAEMRESLRRLNKTCPIASRSAVIKDDDDVQGKKKGDKLILDLSEDSCTMAPREKKPACTF